MIAAMLEKFRCVVTMVLLYVQGQLQFGQFAVAIPISCWDYCLWRRFSKRQDVHDFITLLQTLSWFRHALA
jgi:hypothetical protein